MSQKMWIRLMIISVVLGLGCQPSQGEFDRAASGTGMNAAWMPVLTDVDDRRHEPFHDAATRALVVVFVLPECPIANSYLPELNRLDEDYRPRGVSFMLVHADRSVTSESARAHANEYQVTFPVLLDPKHELVQRARATRTPEVAMFDRAGELRYRGRIDDRYVALGKRRSQATTRDLRDALDAILAGKQPFPPFTEAVGCFIPD